MTRELLRELAPSLAGHGIAQETYRLHALEDGLAVHTAMRPDTTTPEEMLAIVRGSPARPAARPCLSVQDAGGRRETRPPATGAS